MILDQFSLDGKTALVTGASGGLGAAIAVSLAEAGAAVACHGSRAGNADGTVARIGSFGGRAFAVTGELSDKSVPKRLIEEVAGNFGRLDILVNNAGTIRRSPAADYSDQDWDDVIEINLSSVFRLCREVGKVMLNHGGGKIINIASLLSFQGGITVPAYTASKSAVAGLTKALANEWARSNINVNAIAPGYMITNNTAALRADENRNRQILERIPAGRWGSPEDIAGAAVFLSSAASDYLHGHVMAVDGGWLGR